ncbi:MAG: hypothetical protein QXN21_00675 [Candidatus Bathyarchaeia archaeon]
MVKEARAEKVSQLLIYGIELAAKFENLHEILAITAFAIFKAL